MNNVRNETIEIKALENGYIVEFSWYDESAKDEPFRGGYKTKKWMYASWDEVTDWVKANALTIPPLN